MKFERNIVYLHLAVLLFGFAGLFGKWVLLPPIIIVFGRVFFAAIALIVVAWFTNTLKFPNQWYKYSILGILLALHWISFFASIQLSTIALGLLSFSSFPIFTNVLEPLLLKSPIQIRNIWMSFIALLGIYWIIPDFSLDNQSFIGILYGLFSGLTFSLLSIWNKKLVSDINPLLVALFQDSFACLFLLPGIFFLKSEISYAHIGQLAILGILFTAVAHTWFLKGLKTVSAGKASLIATLEPLYGILGGMLFLNEFPPLNTYLGGILILTGVIFSKK
jgi:drug/metabolite transporter (DMT)-like permease